MMEKDEYTGILSTYDPEVAARWRAKEQMEDVAMRMLEMGLSKAQISQATNLSIEEIERIEPDMVS
jgi:predicted transposase YdaD